MPACLPAPLEQHININKQLGVVNKQTTRGRRMRLQASGQVTLHEFEALVETITAIRTGRRTSSAAPTPTSTR
jgi:hypothetical protein